MLTKDKILPGVGKNLVGEQQRDRLIHWVAPDAADPDEAGHRAETLKIFVNAKTPEQEEGVLRTLKQSLSVFPLRVRSDRQSCHRCHSQSCA